MVTQLRACLQAAGQQLVVAILGWACCRALGSPVAPPDRSAPASFDPGDVFKQDFQALRVGGMLVCSLGSIFV